MIDTTTECLKLFNELSMVRHLELFFGIIVFVKNVQLLVYGSPENNKKFNVIIKQLESSTNCAHKSFSKSKRTQLKTLCEKHLVNFEDIVCSDALKLRLIDYFSTLSKNEILDANSAEQSLVETNCLEVYRKPCTILNESLVNPGKKCILFIT